MSARPPRSLADAFAEFAAPPPRYTVAEWADEHRQLDTKSAVPGRWRTDRTPYLREPMEMLSPQCPTQTGVIMFASQLGKSEIINNAVGRCIHMDPASCMVVQPTVDTAKDYNKQRLRPMIKSTPALSERVQPARSRDSESTLSYIAFTGGFVALSGANSAASLASKPICLLFLDEVDRYPEDVDGEGDPVELAVQRTSTFRARRKILMTSTPTIRGESRIEQAYIESDQRRFYVPCPHCGERQVLQWAHLQYETNDDGARRRVVSAHYTCQLNGCVIEHASKRQMLAWGEWRAENPGHPVRGYHLSALYCAPELGPSWMDLAQQWVDAQGDPERLQTFINLRLGETYDTSGGKTFDEGDLLARRVALPMVRGSRQLPREVSLLTAGVDVQQGTDDGPGWLEMQVIGWGSRLRSYPVDLIRIQGDTSDPADQCWDDLDDALCSLYDHPARALPILAAGVDVGWNTDVVCDFIRPRQKRGVVAVKGSSTQTPSEPIWPPRAKGRKGKRRDVAINIVGTYQAKWHIHDRLKIPPPEPGQESAPGYVQFPMAFWSGLPCDADYMAQLTAETLRPVKGSRNKHKRWHLPAGRRNEVLDTWVYAYAVLIGVARARNMDPHQLIEWHESALDAGPRQPTATPATKPKQPAPKRGGWLKRQRGWLG